MGGVAELTMARSGAGIGCCCLYSTRTRETASVTCETASVCLGHGRLEQGMWQKRGSEEAGMSKYYGVAHKS